MQTGVRTSAARVTGRLAYRARAALIVALVFGLLSASCSNPGAQPTGNSLAPGAASVSEADMRSFNDMLAETSNGLGKVLATSGGSGARRLCVIEEEHTSVVGQLEIALMLLRLHDRHGLRHIALEGLTTDKRFPNVEWFRNLAGPDEDDLRNEILVGLLRDGEISAVELIAMAYPDVTVHAVDPTDDYAVELTKKGSAAGVIYLYKIGLKSLRPEHYARVEQLNRGQKINELIEYVISLDGWAKQRFEQLKQRDRRVSVDQMLTEMREIEERAKSAGAQITDEERAAMSEVMAFFNAAGRRSLGMVDIALRIDPSAQLIALNIGAAHTDGDTGVRRALEKARVTYGVLTPLGLVNNTEAADLAYEAYERKGKGQSVAFTGKGLASLLDGRKKPPPTAGADWVIGASHLKVATALLVRAAGRDGFPDENLRRRIGGLDHIKVHWDTVKMIKGDVLFRATVRGASGTTDIWTRAGKPKVAPVKREGRKLEEILREELDRARLEKGPRNPPAQTPAREIVTPDILAVYSRQQPPVMSIQISG